MLYLDSELRGPNIHAALVFTMISNLKLFLSPSVKILVESQKPLLIWPNWASKWENIYINTSDLSESPPSPAHSLAGLTSPLDRSLCSQIDWLGLI